MPIYQPFCGVFKGLVLKDDDCDMIAETMLTGTKEQREQAARYIQGSARTWLTAISRDEYERSKKTQDALIRSIKETGTTE